jgi:hypothetical protein
MHQNITKGLPLLGVGQNCVGRLLADLVDRGGHEHS